MAYSRWSDSSQVYVFMHVNGTLNCCGCWLDGEQYFDSTQAMIDHLAKHRAAGHAVPAYVEAALLADDEQNFPPQCAEGHAWGEPFHPYPDSEFASFVVRRKCTRCDWEDN